MKTLLTIFFAILTFTVIGQSEPKILKLRLDTCKYSKKQIGASTINGNPIYIANGIIVNSTYVNPDSVVTYDIVICPESFKRYMYIGSQGAIVMDTKQSFEFTTPKQIKENKKITGDVLFAINSLLLLDSSFKISPDAINEIEFTNSVDPFDGKTLKPCINIWTIPKKDREKYFIYTVR